MLDRVPRHSPGLGERRARHRGDLVHACRSCICSRTTWRRRAITRKKPSASSASSEIGSEKQSGSSTSATFPCGRRSRRRLELFEQCPTIARSIEHQELESECERNLGELAAALQATLQGAQTRGSRARSRSAGTRRTSAARRSALWRLGKDRSGEWRLRIGAQQFGRSAAGFASLRNELGSTGLPGVIMPSSRRRSAAGRNRCLAHAAAAASRESAGSLPIAAAAKWKCE